MSGNNRLGTVLLAVLLLGAEGSSSASGRANDDLAPFAVKFRNQVVRQREIGIFVLPGESLTFELVADGPGASVFEARGGEARMLGRNTWRWRAPDAPGLYRIEVTGPDWPERNARKAGPDGKDGKDGKAGKDRTDGNAGTHGRDEKDQKDDTDTIKLNAFVMVPAGRVTAGRLNGYQIGSYPARPLRNNPMYRAPRGFVEVTKDNADTRVSPHFRLRQFLSKQESGFPKYVVLQERLLIKLEEIIARLNQLGYDVDNLHVMSGYRTPFYNKAIGNVTYSIHQWGGAADIFVDEDENGTMDDLNKDRRIDRADAVVLYSIIDRMTTEPRHRHLQGGLGYYPGTSAHGPFVHIDVRGTAARWAE